jgi:hypothetical protein
MKLRFLASGLMLFAVMLVLAALPVLAQGQARAPGPIESMPESH